LLHTHQRFDGEDECPFPQVLLNNITTSSCKNTIESTEMLPGALEFAPVVRLNEARCGAYFVKFQIPKRM